MGILDKVVKLEKQIEKLAVRKDVPATPLEIRKALLEDIEEHVQPAGRGRKAFPFDRLSIRVLVAPADRPALEAVLDPEQGFADAVAERLHEVGVERVPKLQIEVKALRKAPADWQPGAFEVVYERSEKRPPAPLEAPVAAATPTPHPAQLVVVDGEATKKTYTLAGERVNIGRLVEVTDKHQRVMRRNQVVFLENDSSPNQTVSRAQAHITITAGGDYRLYDDGSSYGTRVVREGRMIEIPSGSPRGVKLRSGDEIYFGRARVVFRFAP